VCISMSNEEFQKLVLEKLLILDGIKKDVEEIKKRFDNLEKQGNRIEDQVMKLSEYKQAVNEKLQDIVNL
jgi:hypothetical protein